MNDNLLYKLEYEVAELREAYINQVKYDRLTLEEALDLGFNNIFINNRGFYKDYKGECVIDGYMLENKELLEAEIEYVDHELNEADYMETYLEVYCKFVDEKYNDLLEKEVKTWK